MKKNTGVNDTPGPGAGSLFERFMVVAALAYVGGIAAARINLEYPGTFYFTAALALLLFTAAWRLGFTDFYRALMTLLVAAAGAAAFSFAALPTDPGIAIYAGSPVYIEGTVCAEPLVMQDHCAYRLRVEVVETGEGRFTVPGTLLVKIFGEREHEDVYRFGERLRLRGTIVEPRGRRNPGGFDYRYHLRSEGVDAVVYPAPARVSSLGEGDPGLLQSGAVRLRNAMSGAIEEELPSPAAELLTAILFGRRQGLPEAVEENFRRAGAGHLMAVSGLHVGLVAAMILALRGRLGFRGPVPLVMAIILVFAYAYLTGMRPSALRAAIMASAALGALLLDRERDLPAAIALAALASLFFNPLLLFTVGFQLSYAATLAIVYLYRPIEKGLVRLRLPPLLRSPLAVTVAAQVGVMPLVLYHFHSLPLGALFFNLLLLPLVAFVVGLGLGGALLSLVAALPGSLLLWAARPLLELMLLITSLSRMPGLYLNTVQPSLLLVAFLYLLMIFLAAAYYRWEKGGDPGEARPYGAFLPSLPARSFAVKGLLPAIALLLMAASAVAWFGNLSRQQSLTVTFIDVGQGASTLIEPPCGAVIMVDAGGPLPFGGGGSDIGEMIVLPLLRHKGIKTIDLALVTHPHEDHFAGFSALVGVVNIDRIIVSPVEGGPPAYYEMLEKAAEEGVVVSVAVAGYSFACPSGLVMEVIGPPGDLVRGSTSELNDNSLVLKLRYGEVSILLTGDIEDAAVRDLLKRKVDMEADLLQVPHHGGYMEGMPLLVEAVGPAAAVIPVGPNPFGHPHPATVSVLEEAGVAVYRTDLHGAVIIETGGAELRVSTMEEHALAR